MDVRVSVVIPTRDRRDLVAEAVASALDRIGPEDEVVVVDDGSTDGTAEDFAAPPPGVRFMRAEGRGPAHARNVGIHAARGRFVAFLDSDDRWLPVGLDEQVAALAEGRFGLSYADRTPEWTGPETREGEVFADLLRGNFVTTSTVVATREVLLGAGGFDEEIPLSEDWDLWLRIAEARPFHHLRETVAVYRFHEGQMIRDGMALDEGRVLVLEKALERGVGETGMVKRLLAYRLLRLGRRRLAAGDRERGRECLRGAVRVHRPAFFTAARYRLTVRGPR